MRPAAAWSTSSNTGATRLTSSGAIDVSSTKTSVLVASPKQVLLAAAGAAIQIDSGNITINAPGAVEFKAGLKNLTSAGQCERAGCRPRRGQPATLRSAGVRRRRQRFRRSLSMIAVEDAAPVREHARA